MSRILALDLGTRCGFALGRNGCLVMSGTWFEKPDRFSGGGMRYLRFRQWLIEMHRLQPIDVVYFEEVRAHRSPKGGMLVDTAHAYGGFLAHLTAWCEEQSPKVPYMGLPVTTIKKSATGAGNAGKPEMIRAANKRWGKTLNDGKTSKDDNEADALAILGFVFDTVEPEQPVSRRRFLG